MNYEYVCKKVVPKKEDIYGANIYFRNGDYFSVAKSEIIELKVEYYDKLVSGGRGFVPFAKSGSLKLKLSEKKKRNYSFLMYGGNELKKNRKKYLENHCVEEGGAFYFNFTDKLNWSRSFYADAVATLDGEYLVFTFLENMTMGSYESDCHNVKIRELRTGAIHHILLSFENCDGIKVYPEEIKEICLNYKEELCYNSDSYSREVSGGYLRIKFDNDYISWHLDENIYGFEKKPNIKKLENRIVGKKGESDVDICRLYVTYTRADCSHMLEECISVPELNDIKTDADSKLLTPETICKIDQRLEEAPDDELEEYSDYRDEPYISGYARKENDGSILIVFSNPNKQ